MVSRPSGESFLRWRCAKGGSPPQKRCRGAAVASSAGASCGVRAEVLLQLTSGAADASREAPRLRAACSSMSFSSRLATEVMALRTIGEGEALPIVDSQRKLLYCAIPKAGCTQIRAARDVAAFSARLGAFRSCLGLKSGAAPVDEMLHGGGRPRWSAARIGDCAANASR